MLVLIDASKAWVLIWASFRRLSFLLEPLSSNLKEKGVGNKNNTM